MKKIIGFIESLDWRREAIYLMFGAGIDLLITFLMMPFFKVNILTYFGMLASTVITFFWVFF